VAQPYPELCVFFIHQIDLQVPPGQLIFRQLPPPKDKGLVSRLHCNSTVRVLSGGALTSVEEALHEAIRKERIARQRKARKEETK
jgi:hypothetical protein